jgi:hypothetical protein
MRIKHSDEERLVVVHFPWMLSLLGLLPVLGWLYLVASGELHRANPVGTWKDDLFKVAVSLLIVAPWAALFLWITKRSVFEFDLIGRQLTWHRAGVFRREEGQMPFDQIRCAMVDVFCGDCGGGCSYRLALSTTQGIFPLMTYFTGSKPSERRYARLAAAINAAMKTNPADGLESDILEKAAAGQMFAAIRLAAKRYDLDLAQAKQFVDELVSGQASPRSRP